MRTIPEVAEDIKSILNNIERTEECTGETLVDINELVDEILTINCYKNKPKTYADRIRAMSDEEMANAMFAVRIDDSKEIPYCKNLKRCEELLDTEDGIPLEMCKQCLFEWLQSEVGKTGG